MTNSNIHHRERLWRAFWWIDLMKTSKTHNWNKLSLWKDETKNTNKSETSIESDVIISSLCGIEKVDVSLEGIGRIGARYIGPRVLHFVGLPFSLPNGHYFLWQPKHWEIARWELTFQWFFTNHCCLWKWRLLDVCLMLNLHLQHLSSNSPAAVDPPTLKVVVVYLPAALKEERTRPTLFRPGAELPDGSKVIRTQFLYHCHLKLLISMKTEQKPITKKAISIWYTKAKLRFANSCWQKHYGHGTLLEEGGV